MEQESLPYQHNNSFQFDRERFRATLDTVYEAFINQERIFREGTRKFVPQWNLPEDIEEPGRGRRPLKLLEASLWLWGRNYCDRLSVSSYLMKRAKEAWEDENLRWIFYPEEIVKRSVEEVERGLLDSFNYALPIVKNKVSAGKGYHENAHRILEHYEGDPRKIIEGKSTEQAIKELRNFRGIKSIANLIMVEFLERGLASPSDPEKLLFKIDRHLMRIPINVDAMLPPVGSRTIHHQAGVTFLEGEYLSYCHDRGLTVPESLDLNQSIWTLGSEVCSEADYKFCQADCPLVDRFCGGLVKYNAGGRVKNNDGTKGRYIAYDENGKRIDMRKSNLQPDLFSGPMQDF